ncbi:hypothetical protein F5B20DRAFT_288673 [Whalleya microplaca]|nr:hypothetical protein F5B20DRAFT_288673 [Whalleya microplaca]
MKTIQNLPRVFGNSNDNIKGVFDNSNDNIKGVFDNPNDNIKGVFDNSNNNINQGKVEVSYNSNGICVRKTMHTLEAMRGPHRSTERPRGSSGDSQESRFTHTWLHKGRSNTLGLTPGDDDSDDGVDEEKHLEELLGVDAPIVPDLAAWLAERKANYGTR